MNVRVEEALVIKVMDKRNKPFRKTKCFLIQLYLILNEHFVYNVLYKNNEVKRYFSYGEWILTDWRHRIKYSIVHNEILITDYIKLWNI